MRGIIDVRGIIDLRSFPKHSCIDQFIIKQKFKEIKSDEKNECCSICLVEYEQEDNIAKLNCLHYYHYECILPWLRDYKKTCPYCKKKLTINDKK